MKVTATPAQFFSFVAIVAAALEEVIRQELLPAQYAGLLAVLVVVFKAYLVREDPAPSTPSQE